MPPTTEYDDSTLARLLAEDAKASSTRYASQGLSALLPRRVNGNAPKPNTRFLKNLVRDADSHNAALKRKEEQEHRERLRKPEDSREYKRHDSQRARDERPHKRRRLGDRGSPYDRERRGRNDNRHRHQRRNTSSERSGSPSRSSSPPLHRQRREAAENGRQKRRNRSRDEKRRSRSPERTRHSTKDRHHNDVKSRRVRSPSTDPLEDLVGPLPSPPQTRSPVRSRGRGVHKHNQSAMDSHFSTDYDPALDVHPDSEDSVEKEDWDMALEALRDRQQWKQKHADRMREAGFDDHDIKKWEDSGKERSINDVKWRKAGEGREWDAGKVQESDEDVKTARSKKPDFELAASWKRKSGALLKTLGSVRH